jgi:hypothetical protein
VRRLPTQGKLTATGISADTWTLHQADEFMKSTIRLRVYTPVGESQIAWIHFRRDDVVDIARAELSRIASPFLFGRATRMLHKFPRRSNAPHTCTGEMKHAVNANLVANPAIREWAKSR